MSSRFANRSSGDIDLLRQLIAQRSSIRARAIRRSRRFVGAFAQRAGEPPMSSRFANTSSTKIDLLEGVCAHCSSICRRGLSDAHGAIRLWPCP
jgi:hypothetical protein